MDFSGSWRCTSALSSRAKDQRRPGYDRGKVNPGRRYALARLEGRW